MNKVLTLILISFLSLNVLGQNFEGQITYQNTFKSKLSNVSDQQWASMVGSTQDYFIKGGNYRSNMNGTMVLWQLYINNENKLYNKFANSESILWNDASANQDEVLKAEQNENVATILGYQCDELVLTCKSGVQKYYFSSRLKVDKNLFLKHKYGNWAAYVSGAGALPLKIIVDNGQFHMESLATKVESSTLDDALFILPQDAKTAKSPY